MPPFCLVTLVLASRHGRFCSPRPKQLALEPIDNLLPVNGKRAPPVIPFSMTDAWTPRAYLGKSQPLNPQDPIQTARSS
ncbi:hypothetical protein E2562_034665 [Oryza meyeriana var. granulata]|uniref:Uncharacterized protein n=1 Tax=Oryza meyeriana var. granulata TaxID=110450 RepID=A0A6G1EDE1_9ORYZ|nr:hypothetical protein E2562_034665 [Oryza meyeriana var. granulata]